MKMYKQLKKQRGTSLLEILITMVVLGIGLTSLTVFQSNVSSSNTLAEQRTQASHLAQKQIEKLKDLRSSAAYEALTSSNGLTVVGSSDNTEYKLSWNVNSGAAADYQAMSVKVQWKDKKGDRQEVNLHTVAGNDDPLRIAALANPAIAANNGCMADNSDEGGDDGIDDDSDNDGNDDGGSDDGMDDDSHDRDSGGDDGIDDDSNNDGNDDGGSDDGADDDSDASSSSNDCDDTDEDSCDEDSSDHDNGGDDGIDDDSDNDGNDDGGSDDGADDDADSSNDESCGDDSSEDDEDDDSSEEDDFDKNIDESQSI